MGKLFAKFSKAPRTRPITRAWTRVSQLAEAGKAKSLFTRGECDEMFRQVPGAPLDRSARLNQANRLTNRPKQHVPFCMTAKSSRMLPHKEATVAASFSMNRMEVQQLSTAIRRLYASRFASAFEQEA